MVSAHVAVIGGGISGLSAAYRVLQGSSARVTVFEGSRHLGGKLALADVGGVQVDIGAEAMLNRRDEGVELARAVGLSEHLVYPATTQANLWNRGRVVPMPKTLMGIPGRVSDVKNVLSVKGLARAAMEPVMGAPAFSTDVSVGHLVDERFGREVTDRLVEPLLGGVYAGHARELSLAAAVPQVFELAREKRALSMAVEERLSATAPTTPVFAGLRGGMGTLAVKVAEAVEVHPTSTVRTQCAVREIARASAGGWNLVVGSAAEPEVVHADAVIVAVPAPAAAKLLKHHAPRAALDLARIEMASMAVVTLAFERSTFPEVAGSGFLVPPVDQRRIKAATYSFNKWGWVRKAGDQVDDGLLMMRTSIGRHREEAVLQASDEELVSTSVADLGEAIGLRAEPVDWLVQRWGGGLPQYAVGHLERVGQMRREIADVPNLEICGASYSGVGIPACISSGYQAVDGLEVLDTMSP